jgi:hypothetical protein
VNLITDYLDDETGIVKSKEIKVHRGNAFLSVVERVDPRMQWEDKTKQGRTTVYEYGVATSDTDGRVSTSSLCSGALKQLYGTTQLTIDGVATDVPNAKEVVVRPFPVYTKVRPDVRFFIFSPSHLFFFFARADHDVVPATFLRVPRRRGWHRRDDLRHHGLHPHRAAESHREARVLQGQRRRREQTRERRGGRPDRAARVFTTGTSRGEQEGRQDEDLARAAEKMR